MPIDLQAVDARLQELREQRDRTLAQFNALVGAVNDCEYWRDVLLKDREAPDAADPLHGADDRTR